MILRHQITDEEAAAIVQITGENPQQFFENHIRHQVRWALSEVEKRKKIIRDAIEEVLPEEAKAQIEAIYDRYAAQVVPLIEQKITARKALIGR